MVSLRQNSTEPRVFRDIVKIQPCMNTCTHNIDRWSATCANAANSQRNKATFDQVLLLDLGPQIDLVRQHQQRNLLQECTQAADTEDQSADNSMAGSDEERRIAHASLGRPVACAALCARCPTGPGLACPPRIQSRCSLRERHSR